MHQPMGVTWSPMKPKRHNPEQIIRQLRSAERLLNQGKPVADVCRALKVSAATYHRCSISTTACGRSRPEAMY